MRGNLKYETMKDKGSEGRRDRKVVHGIVRESMRKRRERGVARENMGNEKRGKWMRGACNKGTSSVVKRTGKGKWGKKEKGSP